MVRDRSRSDAVDGAAAPVDRVTGTRVHVRRTAVGVAVAVALGRAPEAEHAANALTQREVAGGAAATMVRVRGVVGHGLAGTGLALYMFGQP